MIANGSIAGEAYGRFFGTVHAPGAVVSFLLFRVLDRIDRTSPAFSVTIRGVPAVGGLREATPDPDAVGLLVHPPALPPGSIADGEIRAAITAWNTTGAIRIEPRAPEDTDHVVIGADPGSCSARVGRSGGAQTIMCALDTDPVAVPPVPIRVTLHQQAADTVTARFVDRSGLPSVAWVDGTGPWNAPIRIGGASAPRGAPVAAVKQTADVLTALFVDTTGVLSAAWVVGTGTWTPPQPI